MASGDPIRVFVTHAWHETDDSLRVFEFLENARNFRYRNCSAPDRRPASGSAEAEREELRQQIAAAEAVIGLCCLMPQDLALLQFQLVCAKSLHKPVLLLPAFGQALRAIPEFKGLVDESLQWDERALVDALRRQARHEETNRWDVVEFKLD
jgi:hypothetical protein